MHGSIETPPRLTALAKPAGGSARRVLSLKDGCESPTGYSLHVSALESDAPCQSEPRVHGGNAFASHSELTSELWGTHLVTASAKSAKSDRDALLLLQITTSDLSSLPSIMSLSIE